MRMAISARGEGEGKHLWSGDEGRKERRIIYGSAEVEERWERVIGSERRPATQMTVPE